MRFLMIHYFFKSGEDVFKIHQKGKEIILKALFFCASSQTENSHPSVERCFISVNITF